MIGIKKVLVLLAGVLSIFFIGCEIPEEENQPEKVSLEVNFDLPVGAGANIDMVIDENVAYLNEYVTGYGACAIDLDTGNVKWRIKNSFEGITDPVLYEDYLYMVGRDMTDDYENPLYYYLYKINKTNGDMTKTRLAGVDKGKSPRMNRLSENNGVLFWSCANKVNIYFYNLADDLHGIAYTFDNPIAITKRFVFGTDEAGVVAYFSFSDRDKITVPKVYAMRVENTMFTDTLWSVERDFGDGVFTSQIAVREDLLLISSYHTTMMLNRATGDVVWENTTVGGACSDGGFTFSDGNIYFSNFDLDKNLICMNEQTGKVIWTAPCSSTTGGRPLVKNGVVYFMMQSKICMYDADTGENLAYDSSIKGGVYCYDPIYEYKGNLITKTLTETDPDSWGTFYSIKMNYKP